MNAPHNDEEITAFMKAVSNPEFKASQQPITVAEANRLREAFMGVTQQLNLALQKFTAQKQTIQRLESKVADLETEAQQVREHYKTFNSFRDEVKSCLQLLGDRVSELSENS